MIRIDALQGPMAAAWRDDPCSVFYALAAHHPGQPAAVEIGQEHILVFQDAAAARHIARTRPENYNKNFGAFADFFGNSRLTADGDRWAKLQKISQPSITATDPQRVVAAVSRHFTAAIDQMLAAGAAGPVLVDRYLDRAAASVIAEATLGFGPDDIAPTLLDDFRTILRYGSLTTWNLPGTAYVESGVLLDKAGAARGRLLDGLERLLTRDRRSPGGQTDLLRALIGAEDDVDLFSEICTLMFAGSDTTAAALGWAMWLLAESRDLQDRLAGEVKAVVGDTEPTLETVDRLVDVVAFNSEVLRIYPPIPILSRVAVEADRIGEVDVEKDQKVLLSIIGLHHDATVYPSPSRTSLSRFPGGEVSRELVGHFLPFGLGRRACGGARIASLEVTTAIALLVRRLVISNPSLYSPVAFEWVASLRPRDPHRLTLKAR